MGAILPRDNLDKGSREYESSIYSDCRSKREKTIGYRGLSLQSTNPFETFYPFPLTDLMMRQHSNTSREVTGHSDSFPWSSNSSVVYTPPPHRRSQNSNAGDAPPSTAAVEWYHERIRATVERPTVTKRSNTPRRS
jgi:hypothetical protein